MNGGEEGETLRAGLSEYLTYKRWQGAQKLARECVKKNYVDC